MSCWIKNFFSNKFYLDKLLPNTPTRCKRIGNDLENAKYQQEGLVLRKNWGIAKGKLCV